MADRDRGRRVHRILAESSWLRSWRVVSLLAFANLVVVGTYAGYGLFVRDAEGIPAAGLVMIGIGSVAIFVVALVLAVLLYAGVAKPVVAGGMLVVGVVLALQDPVRPELTVSGVLGTTAVAIAVIGGALGLYEARSTV